MDVIMDIDEITARHNPTISQTEILRRWGLFSA